MQFGNVLHTLVYIVSWLQLANESLNNALYGVMGQSSLVPSQYLLAICFCLLSKMFGVHCHWRNISDTFQHSTALYNLV